MSTVRLPAGSMTDVSTFVASLVFRGLGRRAAGEASPNTLSKSSVARDLARPSTSASSPSSLPLPAVCSAWGGDMSATGVSYRVAVVSWWQGAGLASPVTGSFA